jgi:anhydro-N-acetylmuramic acid kinase
MLCRLINKKRLTVLGLNSGTSCDGLDLAIVSVRRTSSSAKVSFVSGGYHRYPASIRRRVLDAAESEKLPLEELIHVDNLLGHFFGQTAAAFLKRSEKQGIRVDFIASHGQTVRHAPQSTAVDRMELRGTLQLGSLDQIAARTGKIVVGDFRQADIALGNEGAPITVAAVQRMFADPAESRLIVNIGGMSNFFYFPATKVHRTAAAADCGPGNSLSDLLTERLFQERYDRDGRHARAGQVSHRLLAVLTAEPFFTGANVSTGREVFGTRMVDRMIAFGDEFNLSGEDLIATAIELTVLSIARAIHPLAAYDRSLAKMYLTGGGAHNRFLRQRLAAALNGLSVGVISDLGFSPDLVEAASFAVLGEACLRSEPTRSKFSRESARTRRQTQLPILGKIVQPPRMDKA